MNKKIEWERVRFESISSTNDYAKERRGEKKNLIVTAIRQTGGKGTKGRSFSSEEGGVYATKLTFYEDFPAKEAFKIMQNAAVAVCETLAFLGLKPLIKWPNDIYVSDKKICGILIENTFSGTNVSSSLVGIGINIYNSLPQELEGIATSVLLETGIRQEVETVCEKLIEELSKEHTEEQYLSYIGYMGKEVTLIIGDECVQGRLVCVEKDGKLRVETDEGEALLSSAEVSVRI
jgi:BirA family biotin operon repressor/biotin-[acetyl-CoA-carboxylase] ligase